MFWADASDAEAESDSAPHSRTSLLENTNLLCGNLRSLAVTLGMEESAEAEGNIQFRIVSEPCFEAVYDPRLICFSDSKFRDFQSINFANVFTFLHHLG